MLVLTFMMIDSDVEEQREFATEISANKFIAANCDVFEYYYLENEHGEELVSC